MTEAQRLVLYTPIQSLRPALMAGQHVDDLNLTIEGHRTSFSFETGP